MRNFIITIFIAASAVLSGCATPVDLDVFREGHPGVIRTSQGKFVKAVPIKPKPHKTGLVGGTADIVGMNAGGGALGGAALAISLIDAFGSSDSDGREIHLQDENTGEPIVFEVGHFAPHAGLKPAVGDVMKFVWLKDDKFTYTNLTRYPKMRNYAP